ncbi:MAG: thioredoxin [Halanaerobiaceae bacterium]
MSEPKKVTDENFQEEVINSDKPVLVDFWAEWCGPCKMVAPVVEDIAEEYEDKVKVCKLNVDENQGTAAEYGVMSIPTLIYFENGEEADKVVGYQPKENIVNKLGLN